MTDVVVHTGLAAGAEPSAGSDTAARITVVGGGSAANVAAWAAALGTPTALIARVGDDDLGRRAVRELDEAGVECHVRFDPERSTGVCVVLVDRDGQRTMLPDAGANAVWAADEVPEVLVAGAGQVHLVGYALLRDGARAAALRALAVAAAHGVPVSVDPSSAAPLAAAGPVAFFAWTAGAALLVANLDEAAVLTGLGDPEASAAALSERYPEVVVKLGAAGSLWASRGVGPVHRAGEVVEAQDTTGAGDAFAAAYLGARLAGAPPDVALQAGNAAGARVVQQPGARPGRE